MHYSHPLKAKYHHHLDVQLRRDLVAFRYENTFSWSLCQAIRKNM